MSDIRKEEDWNQISVIHCPDYDCKGLLLEHPNYFPYLCSDCNKLWERKVEWKEVQVMGELTK